MKMKQIGNNSRFQFWAFLRFFVLCYMAHSCSSLIAMESKPNKEIKDMSLDELTEHVGILSKHWLNTHEKYREEINTVKRMRVFGVIAIVIAFWGGFFVGLKKSHYNSDTDADDATNSPPSVKQKPLPIFLK